MEHLAGREGMDAEFSSVVREHARSLHLLAWRVTKCEQLAKDIVQEVFLKLWEHRNRMSEIENKEAWLYRVTENKLIDHLRKVAVERKLRTETWNRIRESANETEQRISARESGRLISKAIDSLPPQRKAIYRLHREDSLSHHEIAEALHISPHTVKNQLSSALQYLRTRLKGMLSL